MSSSNNTTGPKPVVRRASAVPAWARPLIVASSHIYISVLWLTGIALAVILGMLFLGNTSVQVPWLAQAVTAFTLGALLGFLTTLIANYDSLTPGWITLAIGVALAYGGNFAIIAIAGGKAAQFKGGETDYVKTLSTSMQGVGSLMMGMSIIRLMIGYTVTFLHNRATTLAMRQKFMNAGKTAKVVQTKLEKPSFIPKCWQMSRCRPGVRQSCPNYIDKATCWKRRSGCFCDRDLANYLMSAVERGGTEEVMDVQMASNALASSNVDKKIQQDKSRNAKRRPWRQQKTLCHACPLYVEHQEYKYKHFHWLSAPVTICLLVFGYPFFDECYKGLAKFLDAFAQELVKRGGLPENFVPTSGTLINSPFEYVLLAAVGLILGSYIVALVDKLFLEWKM